MAKEIRIAWRHWPTGTSGHGKWSPEVARKMFEQVIEDDKLRFPETEEWIEERTNVADATKGNV